MSSVVSETPKRVKVKELVDGRYSPGLRPVNWGERSEGLEVIRSEDGTEYLLFSNGGQSTPAPGWELLLRDSVAVESRTARTWTLYGVSPS